MGEVYKAEHLRMKRHVVIKVLHPENTKSETALRRFQREVEAAAKLYHPNIVTAFDAGNANQVHYLVMEFIDGQPLSKLVNEKETKEENYHRIERSYGSFFRSFSIPHYVDQEKIKAEHEHGVLKVQLPKKHESKPRAVKILKPENKEKATVKRVKK